MELFVVLLFIAAMMSFFIKAIQPIRKSTRKPKYKQYDEGRNADYFMKSISKAYNIQEEQSEEDESEEGYSEETFVTELVSENKEAYYGSSIYDPEEDEQEGSFLLSSYSPQHPLMIGIFLLLGFVVLKELLPELASYLENHEWIENFVLVIPFFLIGLSGLMVIQRGKNISRSGKIVYGFEAYLGGIFRLLVGWGTVLLLLSKYL
ncbi:MAG: hypothetical protein U0V02_17235 [Anaerolineales bacterium]